MLVNGIEFVERAPGHYRAVGYLDMQLDQLSGRWRCTFSLDSPPIIAQEVAGVVERPTKEAAVEAVTTALAAWAGRLYDALVHHTGTPRP